MPRFLLALIAIFTVACANAQDRGMAEQGVDWLRSAWSSVQRQGRPAAEKVIKEFPDRFKQIPKNVTDLSKKVTKMVGDMKLEEKQAMLGELWRVRHCVNLMALLDSEVLQTVTGIDTKMLKQMTLQIQQITKQLSPHQKS